MYLAPFKTPRALRSARWAHTDTPPTRCHMQLIARCLPQLRPGFDLAATGLRLCGPSWAKGIKLHLRLCNRALCALQMCTSMCS